MMSESNACIDSVDGFDQNCRGDEAEKETANSTAIGEASASPPGVIGSASKERDCEGEEEDSQSKKVADSTVDEGNLNPSLLHRTHGKRRNLGRAARRRRRKFLDIQQREEEIRQQHLRQQQQKKAEGSDNQESSSSSCQSTQALMKESSSSSVIPVDRDKVWPAVAKLRRQFATADNNTQDSISRPHNDDSSSLDSSGWRGAADERALIGQLGFLPGNAIRVCTRIKDLRNQNGKREEQQHGEDNSIPTMHATTVERTLLAYSSSSSRPQSSNKNDYHDVLDKEDDHVPVVLQLYPLVLRDEYAGGKSDGRKFKSRKRLRNKIDQPIKETDDGGDDVAISSETSKSSRQEEEIADAAEPSSSSLTNNAEATVVVEPFPTIYWLTHPFLRVWISRLELDGLGVRLEQRLAAPENEASLERMKRAHEAYAQERMALLTESDRALVQSRHWDDALLKTNRGVAGVRNPKAVKCLHAHAAHYLSGGWGCQDNVIGEWVMQEVHKMLNERTKQQADDNTKATRSSA